MSTPVLTALLVGLAAGLALAVVAVRLRLLAGRDDDGHLADRFSALAAQALERNSTVLLDLAAARLGTTQAEARGDLRSLVEPLQLSLGRVEERLHELELARQEAYVGLSQQVGLLRESSELLRGETANLVTALRAPATRGRWGELQLRRVVELAGMVRHCDFVEQPTVGGPDGPLRPDVVVHLPGAKRVVVDAKVPLLAYLAAVDAGSEGDRRRHLGDHARQLRAHVDALSAKRYWQQFQPSPEFVVLFLPGEPLLAAALEHDPALLEHAVAANVLLATPMSLVGLLRAVAFGWRQEALAENAQAICELGRELYARLATLGDHVSGLGRSLDRAVDAYNRTIGSLESRVLVTARRFADLGVTGADIPVPEPVEIAARRPQSGELASQAPIVSLGDAGGARAGGGQ